MNLSSYRRQLAYMTRDELLGEVKKLDNLLANLDQAHADRDETITLVLREKEEAKKELSLRYIEEEERKDLNG